MVDQEGGTRRQPPNRRARRDPGPRRLKRASAQPAFMTPPAPALLPLLLLLGGFGDSSTNVEAAFTPPDKGAAQGAALGCVGSCEDFRVSSKYSPCKDYCDTSGPWESGTGRPCLNADVDVPSGHGTGKYGQPDSWDVSKIKCTQAHRNLTRCMP